MGMIFKSVAALSLIAGAQLGPLTAAGATEFIVASAKQPSAATTVYRGEISPDNVPFDDSERLKTNPAPGVLASVPEPAVWLTMLLGFGLLGVISRRGTNAADEQSSL